MDNEKLFELMEKMYNKMQKGFIEVKEDINKNTDVIMSLENELKETKKALYDGYMQNAEGIKSLQEKLDELSEKVDNHDIKIQVIEGGKKAL